MSDRSASMKSRALRLLDAKQEEALRYLVALLVYGLVTQGYLFPVLDEVVYHLVFCHGNPFNGFGLILWVIREKEVPHFFYPGTVLEKILSKQLSFSENLLTQKVSK